MAEIEALLSARDKMSAVVKKAAGNTQKQTGLMGKAFKGLSKTVGAAVKGATVALGALGVGVIATARLAGIQEEAEAKLATTVRSMSAETWTSVDALKAQASALQGTSKFGDEAILDMQGLLLTFGSVKNVVGEGNDIFDRASAVILDLSEKMGTDLQTSTIMLGKALNDPILGLTAMRRVGIQFTEQQEDMIKALVESGDTVGAQALMLAELERQYGGTAQAAAEAGTGPFVQFKNILGDIGEAIGRVTLPLLQEWAKWASGKGQAILAWFESPAGVMWAQKIRKAVRETIQRVRGWLEFLTGEFKSRTDAGLTPFEAIIDLAKSAAEWLLKMIPAGVTQNLDGLGQALLILGGPMMLLAREILPRIAPAFDAIIPPLAELVNDLAPIFASLIVTLVDQLLPGLLVMLDGLIGFLAGNGGLVKALGLAVIAFKILTVIMAVNPFILIATAVIAIAALIITNWDTIKAFLGKTWESIKRVAATVWDSIKRVFKGVVDFIVGLFLNFTLPGLLIKHWDSIKKGVTSVGDFIKGVWDGVVSFFTGLPGRIGRAVSGMWDGIKDAFRSAVNWIIGKWNDLEISIGGGTILGVDIPKITVRTPNIPTFHEGGTVPGRPGEEVLIKAQAGETVTPADRSDVRGGNTYHIHTIRDGNRLIREIEDESRYLLALGG